MPMPCRRSSILSSGSRLKTSRAPTRSKPKWVISHKNCMSVMPRLINSRNSSLTTATFVELMGARDLYIAEVYDVGKTGATQKPYGRVFYTRGKSLIFYAYDLDQQAGLTNTRTFQAWGRRGPHPQQALNLRDLLRGQCRQETLGVEI